MWKQQDDTGTLPPLLLARGHELVDHRLPTVGEVAELGLPHDKRIRSLHRIAILEAHRRELAEQRVVHPEARLTGIEIRERRPLPAAHPVHEHRMALNERATPAVLPGQPHWDSIQQQRSDSDQLGEGPVDTAL